MNTLSFRLLLLLGEFKKKVVCLLLLLFFLFFFGGGSLSLSLSNNMFLEGNGTTGGIHTFSSHRQGKEMLATHGENKSVLVLSCFLFVSLFSLFVCFTSI